jgi:uncharacterized membrane protein (Fun14 family)
MGIIEPLRAILIAGPIIGLLTLGLWLSLRSGVVSLSTGQGQRQLMENLSQMIMLLAVYLVGLILIQQIVGFRIGSMW